MNGLEILAGYSQFSSGPWEQVEFSGPPRGGNGRILKRPPIGTAIRNPFGQESLRCAGHLAGQATVLRIAEIRLMEAEAGEGLASAGCNAAPLAPGGSFCFQIPPSPQGAEANRQRDLSIVPPMKGYISTWDFMMN